MTDTKIPCEVYQIPYFITNLLSKPENGRIFHNFRTFHSTEYLAVIIVTDRECNVSNYVVLDIMSCVLSYSRPYAKLSTFQKYLFPLLPMTLMLKHLVEYDIKT